MSYYLPSLSFQMVFGIFYFTEHLFSIIVKLSNSKIAWIPCTVSSMTVTGLAEVVHAI